MSDDADISEIRSQVTLNASLTEIRLKAANIPLGHPGECNMCGNSYLRIVNGACARCRDKYKLL